jgi:hypothetical protein
MPARNRSEDRTAERSALIAATTARRSAVRLLVPCLGIGLDHRVVHQQVDNPFDDEDYGACLLAWPRSLISR